MKSSSFKLIVFLIAAASVTAVFSACASNSNVPADTKAVQSAEPSDEEVLAEEMLNTMLNAMKTNDREKFVRYMVDDMKISITEEAFKAMLTEFSRKKGAYISRKYLGSLDQPFFRVYLWKARFAPSKDMIEAFKKQGKKELEIPVTDTLVRLELGTVGNAVKVFGIYFQ